MGREKTLLDISKAMVFIILSHNRFYTSGWIEGIMQASMTNSSVTTRPNETKSHSIPEIGVCILVPLCYSLSIFIQSLIYDVGRHILKNCEILNITSPHFCAILFTLRNLLNLIVEHMDQMEN